MNKSLIYALLAAGSLAGVAQAAEESLDLSGKDFSDGNWSIVLDLKADKIQSVINGTDQSLIDKGKGKDHHENDYNGYVGVNLVSWSGTGRHTYGPDWPDWLKFSGNYSSRNPATSSFWIGVGDEYFEGLPTGSSEGLQMGFAGGDGNRVTDASIANNPNLYTDDGMENAGYYRSDPKLDVNGDFWQNDNPDGTTMDKLEGITVTSATLALVHSNQNGVGTNDYDRWNGGLVGNQAHSQTMQYLTITGLDADGKEITITYIAEVDDDGLTAPWEDFTSDIGPSSNRFDIDNITNVTINTDYVNIENSFVYDRVLSPGEVGTIAGVLPEPTSATLSMMALTALCARRRRRK